MKKVFVSVSVILALGLGNIQAQGVMGGIKVDANLSNFILDDLDGMETKFGFGFSVGGYTKHEFSEYFALQPEILLHYKNSKTEVKSNALLPISLSGDTDFRYIGVELPIYAVGQKTFGNGKAFIGGGPFVGYGIDARRIADGQSDVNLYKEYGGQKSEMQRWDFGVSAMAGYEFGSRLQIIGTWKLGVINTLNAAKDDAAMMSQSFSLGLGYRFGN